MSLNVIQGFVKASSSVWVRVSFILSVWLVYLSWFSYTFNTHRCRCNNWKNNTRKREILLSNDPPPGSETWRPCGMTHLPWPHPEIPDWLLRLALSNDWLPQTTLMKPFGLWLWLSEKKTLTTFPPWFKVVYTSGRVGRSFWFQRAKLNNKKKESQKRNSLLIRFFRELLKHVECLLGTTCVNLSFFFFFSLSIAFSLSLSVSAAS